MANEFCGPWTIKLRFEPPHQNGSLRSILYGTIRLLLGHGVGPARYIATDRRPDVHGLTNLEFMRRHRTSHVWPAHRAVVPQLEFLMYGRPSRPSDTALSKQGFWGEGAPAPIEASVRTACKLPRIPASTGHDLGSLPRFLPRSGHTRMSCSSVVNSVNKRSARQFVPAAMKLLTALGGALRYDKGPGPEIEAAFTDGLAIAEQLDDTDYQLRALSGL